MLRSTTARLLSWAWDLPRHGTGPRYSTTPQTADDHPRSWRRSIHDRIGVLGSSCVPGRNRGDSTTTPRAPLFRLCPDGTSGSHANSGGVCSVVHVPRADPMAPFPSPRPPDLVLRRSPSFLAASMSRTPSILRPRSISALTAWSCVFPIGRRPSTPRDTDLRRALAERNFLLQHGAIADRHCDMHSLECSKMTTTTMKEVPPRRRQRCHCTRRYHRRHDVPSSICALLPRSKR